jgi:hypothetical protein
MKLIRFGETNKELPGIIIDGNYYDVSGFVNDFDEVKRDNDDIYQMLY